MVTSAAAQNMIARLACSHAARPDPWTAADEDREWLALCEAGESMLGFMRYCWWMPWPLEIGPHTASICGAITAGVDALERGESTFLAIQVCFGHGKSDIVCRAAPAWIQGRLRQMQPDQIVASYGADLSESFSLASQKIIQSESYRRVFPGIELAASAAARWTVSGSAGESIAVGRSGALMGKRGHYIAFDDFLKSFEEAESEGVRESCWQDFRDILSRRHPASLVVVCATPRHVDDIFGRILSAMAADPMFPRFRFLSFPAESPEYPSGYLFPQRFDVAWYASQRATLGIYRAAGEMDCAPRRRGGNVIQVEGIQIVDTMPEGLAWVRGWDLASTAKERIKDSPDFTWGTKIAVRVVDGAPWLYIGDSRWCQAEAPERNRLILGTARADGPECWQVVEGVAGYKDSVTTLSRILEGVSIVRPAIVSGDRVVCASALEPLFEAGHVVMRRATWNAKLIDDLEGFPTGRHDDGTDSITVAYPSAMERWDQRNRFGGDFLKGMVCA